MITVKGVARKLRVEHGADVIMVVALTEENMQETELDISSQGFGPEDLANMLEEAAKTLREGTVSPKDN